MIAVALKGLAGRKVRALLTAVAIVLGVAMISGTYVLTDTINSGFNTIFTHSYKNADVVDHRQRRRSRIRTATGSRRPTLQRSGAGERCEEAPRTSPTPRGLEVTTATSVKLIGRDGKVIVTGGRPSLGFSMDPNQQAAVQSDDLDPGCLA